MTKYKKIAATLVIFIMFFTKAYASSNNISILLNQGFNGLCKADGINSLKLTIKAKADFKETVIIKLGDKKYSINSKIAGGNTKEYNISVPMPKDLREIEVGYDRDNKFIQIDKFPIKFMGNRNFLIGILSDTGDRLNYLNRLNPYSIKDATSQVVNFNGKINYNSVELNNFGLIILDNFNTKGLSKEEQDTLYKWIVNGGNLVIGNGQNTYKNLTGFLSDIKDIKKIGMGSIIPVQYNLEDENSLNNINLAIRNNCTSTVLKKLFNNLDLYNKALAAQQMQATAEHIFNPTYNTLYLLVVLILIYLILMAMSMQFKKSFKLLNIIVIVTFSVFFYLFASIKGMHTSKIVSAGIRDYTAGINESSIINIYPYSSEGIDVNLTKNDFFTEVGTGDYSTDLQNYKMIYRNGNQHYLYTNKQELKDASKIKLSLKDNLITGEIVNPSYYKMNKCFLLIGDSIIKIGSLDEAEKIKLRYHLKHDLLNTSDYTYLSTIYNMSEINTYEQHLFNYYNYYGDISEINCKLIGFTQEYKKLNVGNKMSNVKAMTMNVFPIRLNVDKEKFNLPSGFIKPVVDYNGQKLENSKNEYQLKSGEDIYAYYFIPKNMNLKNIEIFTQVDGGSIIIQGFNYKNNTWENVKSGNISGKNLCDYVCEGPLKLKISGSGRVIIPQISVKGSLNLEGGSNYENK